MTVLKQSLTFIFAVGILSTVTLADEETHITHGPILGRLSAHGVGVWARTNRTATFAVRYGLSPDAMDFSTEPAATRLEHDNTGWVHLARLKADTKYYYELVIPGGSSRTGRGGSFRTLPDARDYVDKELNPKGIFNFSFEFACGNNQNPGHSIGPALPALKTILDKHKSELNFAIQNGDWLYESQREYKPEQWLAQVDVSADQAPKVVRVAPTVVGVWQNYKHFFNQGENLCRWHREIPSFFTYDDHEILNDVWGAGTPGLRDRRAVFRDIGVRAWYDYLGWSNPTQFEQPIHFGEARLAAGSDVLTDSDADFTKLDLGQASNLHVHWGTATSGVNDNALDGVGGEPNAGVYEIVKIMDRSHLQIRPEARKSGEASYSIGRRSYYRMRIANCDFFVLDTRGQREMHDTRQPKKPGLSMLGRRQREWLIDGIRSSDADFIFVVSSVNFMIPHVGGGKVRAENKDDAWTVFLDEREKLIDFWDSLSKCVFVLTGDLHNSFVIRISDNVWEMASGPHNSNNHWASDEGNRPANGKFKYGPREVDIRWSTHFRSDIPRDTLLHPTYCIVQVNNVYDNPQSPGEHRWIAYPKPQVIFRYYDGRTGRLRYAESVLACTGARGSGL
jgi:phosphodiesterase/alkaline phosphatase D-like protein